MNAFGVLVSTPFRAIRNSFRSSRDYPWFRTLFFLFVGLVLLSTVFGLFRVVFHYFYRQPIVGPFLVTRMFSLAFMSFLFMLVYSNIMTSLSSHYLSKDLHLLMAMPIKPVTVFMAKAVEALVGSSWMVIMMCIPLFTAYAFVKYSTKVQFVPDLMAVIPYLALAMFATIPFLLIPAAFSMALTTALMYFFPARRMRELMMLLGTLIFMTVVVAFRLMEPEKLLAPKDETQIFEFMKSLAAPSAPYLPSAWAGRAVVAASNVHLDPWSYWFNTVLLWVVAVFSWIACYFTAKATYLGAWRTSNESMGVRKSVRMSVRNLPLNAGPYAAVMLKDLKVFMREPAQWGQVLLLGALILIYVFNLTKIPPDVSKGLKSLLFFLNLGFIGLIMTAVAARFLFPMVSLEGGTMAILRRAPISMERYLWVRWMGGITPLLFLAMVLIGLSIPILGVDWFMGAVAVATMAGMTLAVSGLAIGCGAAFARFHITNPEEIITSPGGFIYMGLSMFYIVVVLFLEAQPVRIYYWAMMFRREMPGWGPAIAAFSLVVLLTAVCVVIPIRKGAKALERREL
jgi:ABC-2 type transport system permease protein